MMVCITAQSPGLDAPIEPRFARSPFFTFGQTETRETHSVANALCGGPGGAGPRVVQFVAEDGAEALVTGRLDENAERALHAAGIRPMRSPERQRWARRSRRSVRARSARSTEGAGMRLVVASGKGGTGKTTVAANLAFVLARSREVVAVDCDVEAPNLHLYLPLRLPCEVPVRVPVPAFDPARRTLCGECGRFCRFGAISVLKTEVFFLPDLCHNWGGCGTSAPRTPSKMSIGRSDPSGVHVPLNL